MVEHNAEIEQQTLPFLVTVSEGEADSSDSMGMFTRNDEAVLRNVPLGPLRKNLTETIDALQQIFSDAAARGGALPLKEAQLSFQVTSSGGVQLIGTAQIQGTRAITLVFRQ